MADLPEDFDLAALLAPIPGDAPAGIDLRADTSSNSLYYRIRDARGAARDAERAAETAAEGDSRAVPSPAPSWQSVRELASRAIAEQSKDLELAAWLTEALTRSDGLSGATAGFMAMGGLVEGFWEELFPLPDEDGMASRTGPVAGLNGQSRDGTLIQALRQVALFRRPDGAPVRLWQYEQSVELAGVVNEENRRLRIAAGAIPFDDLRAEAAADRAAGFAVLRRHAAEALAAWEALGEALDRRAGADSPPNSRVREILQQFATVAHQFGAPEEEEAAETPATASEEIAGPAAAPTGAPAPGALATREDALRALAAIADYFRRNEPHSPLAYTLQEAVRRARMTWPQLLEEIVPDEASRATILTSLGIRPAPPAG